MGNHQSVSCFFCFTATPSSSNPPTSSLYLLHYLGNHHHHHHQEQVNSPSTAAEIMLEAPGCIVSSAEDMRRTGRVTAMKADDVLFAGKTYFVVPVTRIHCKVSEREMDIIVGLELEEKVRGRRGFGGKRRSSNKISPVAVVQEDKRKLSDDGVGGGDGFCSQQRFCDGNNNNRRRWSPDLESILE